MLAPCWTIKGCGRVAGGAHEGDQGPCPAHPRHGHSCWSVAGTFCGGVVQGTFARKEHQCTTCDVYQRYSTSFGSQRDEFKHAHPEEFARCVATLAEIRRKSRGEPTGQHAIERASSAAEDWLGAAGRVPKPR